MENKILQQTPEWLETKQSKISASEVFSLVIHYCKKELEAMGFDLKEEKSFRTVQELFLKVKFGAKLSDIDPIHSEFGNGMESYIAYRLGQELPIPLIERTKDFIINEGLHPLAACSPDGYLYLPGSSKYPCSPDNPFEEILPGDDLTAYSIPDFDKTCYINANWGFGALELKTANYFANFGSDKGSRLNYIFQHQFQMMVLGLEWGCLAVLLPKEKDFDEPFFKGKTIGKFEESNISEWSEKFDQYYDLKHYIYPTLPVFQAMIMKALNAFQEALDGYDNDQSLFPRNSEDLTGLQREKQMWAQLWPEHYGKKETSSDFLEIEDLELRKKTKKAAQELDVMFNDRAFLQEAKMFAEQDFDKITNEIYQKVKASGLDKFTEIAGTQNRMNWIKNGQVRFYKLKENKE